MNKHIINKLIYSQLKNDPKHKDRDSLHRILQSHFSFDREGKLRSDSEIDESVNEYIDELVKIIQSEKRFSLAGICDVRFNHPDESVSNPEPTIRDVLIRYYQIAFSEVKSAKLADQYIRTLQEIINRAEDIENQKITGVYRNFDKSLPVKTRSGKPARIIDFDFLVKGESKILAAILTVDGNIESESLQTYNKNGMVQDTEHPDDLINII